MASLSSSNTRGCVIYNNGKKNSCGRKNDFDRVAGSPATFFEPLVLNASYACYEPRTYGIWARFVRESRGHLDLATWSREHRTFSLLLFYFSEKYRCWFCLCLQAPLSFQHLVPTPGICSKNTLVPQTLRSGVREREKQGGGRKEKERRID